MATITPLPIVMDYRIAIWLFYFDPKHNTEVGYGSGTIDWPLMHGWIDTAQDIPPNYEIPGDFFFKYEMHMGGCG